MAARATFLVNSEVQYASIMSTMSMTVEYLIAESYFNFKYFPLQRTYLWLLVVSQICDFLLYTTQVRPTDGSYQASVIPLDAKS